MSAIARTPRAIPRREFLARLSAAAASGLAVEAAFAGAAEVDRPMKVSLFSGMFKAFPLETAIRSAAAIGYDGIEIMVGFGADHLDVKCTPERAAEIRRIAADQNLAICQIYTTLGGNVLGGQKQQAQGLDDVARFLDIGDAMSCKMIKVTAGRLKDSAFKEDEARTVADWIARACDRAAKHDARITAEIHFGQYCETVDMAMRMIGLVDRPNFGVIHDAGNLHISGDSYGEESVRRLGRRIFHVHIKDMVRAATDDATAHDYPAGRYKRALLNEGNVDHLSLLRGLKAIHYPGYLSCEATGGDDPTAVAKHEYAEVQKLLKQLG